MFAVGRPVEDRLVPGTVTKVLQTGLFSPEEPSQQESRSHPVSLEQYHGIIGLAHHPGEGATPCDRFT